jgi:hypothetical protein
VEPRVRPGRRRSGLLLFFALVSGASAVWAQGDGDVRLVVEDPTGAATKASGMLLNLDTKAQRNFETDALGGFEFSGLPYNRYQISVFQERIRDPDRARGRSLGKNRIAVVRADRQSVRSPLLHGRAVEHDSVRQFRPFHSAALRVGSGRSPQFHVLLARRTKRRIRRGEAYVLKTQRP